MSGFVWSMYDISKDRFSVIQEMKECTQCFVPPCALNVSNLCLEYSVKLVA